MMQLPGIMILLLLLKMDYINMIIVIPTPLFSEAKFLSTIKPFPMKIFVVIICLCVFIPATGQHKINFNSRNYIGLLEGENGSAFQVETTNGIGSRSWFAGLGTGLDWYYIRSIPLFGSLSKSFLENNNRSFFISTDIGVNFPWKPAYPNEWGYYSYGKYQNGMYFAIELGYTI